MTSTLNPILTLSIVSHGQAHLIRPLLDDLIRLAPERTEVLITLNLPEEEGIYGDLPLPARFLRNSKPLGFGANHNQAFAASQSDYFAIVNPDVRLTSLDLATLLSPMRDEKVGVVAPVVTNSAGQVEDSARRFPTILGLVRRILFRQRTPGYRWDTQPIEVDWSAGMFVVFRRSAFADIGGFDDRRFFMYFEDVDICRRLRHRGWRVLLHPAVRVIHDAQRASHRSLKHLRWHLTSAVRYFTGL